MHILPIFALCLLAALLIWLIILLVHLIRKKPTGQKDWSTDQAILAWADIKADDAHMGTHSQDKIITIHNIRNFAYRTQTDYTQDYYDKTFRLSDIISVDLAVEPFSGHKGAAHTLVTFGLYGDTEDTGAQMNKLAVANQPSTNYIAISIEIRKQKGETFSAVKGLFKKFEIMYVVADERDVISLRANIRRDDVYLYPIKANPEKIREFFLDMLKEVNSLKEKPEFYNTIANTCTTNLVRHANAVSPGRIPWSASIFIPEYFGQLIYDSGLMDDSIPFEMLKKNCWINARAAAAKDDPLFSAKIRR